MVEFTGMARKRATMRVRPNACRRVSVAKETVKSRVSGYVGLREVAVLVYAGAR